MLAVVSGRWGEVWVSFCQSLEWAVVLDSEWRGVLKAIFGRELSLPSCMVGRRPSRRGLWGRALACKTLEFSCLLAHGERSFFAEISANLGLHFTLKAGHAVCPHQPGRQWLGSKREQGVSWETEQRAGGTSHHSVRSTASHRCAILMTQWQLCSLHETRVTQPFQSSSTRFV